MPTKKAGFVPFANEADVLHVGDLMLENRLDRITISGDVDITLDQAGLAHARRLHAILSAVVEKLEGQDLPARLPPPDIKTVDNPFN
ncbi:hypothetical protein G4G28_12470 [Massilia sp. Dwa41.01b]|uniref:hypothetical protein n=1 Tax=unclassified Massilia TaxID=2609279 RepID=UPI00160220F0|nr:MULTISPECIES: hypothetical protein [unclassified Massilia]QNA89084.1 hypothetical protein G4G28_12470 [Massilia sp. Dwa41.01b]QNA99973.1 hypothetical protein G4G31_16065 [Massilia sp. Se16.2.3]